MFRAVTVTLALSLAAWFCLIIAIDLTPDYEPKLKIGCDQTYDYSRFQYRVSDKAIYHAEIFYR